MNEAEWLACHDPSKMLAYLRRSRRCRPTRRRLLLFACACCRRVVHCNRGDWSGDAVALVESLVEVAVEAAVDAALVEAVDEVWECAGGTFTPAEEAVLSLPLPDTGLSLALHDAGSQFSVRDAGRVAIAAARAAGFDKPPYPPYHERHDDPVAYRRASNAATGRRGLAKAKEAAV